MRASSRLVAACGADGSWMGAESVTQIGHVAVGYGRAADVDGQDEVLDEALGQVLVGQDPQIAGDAGDVDPS